MFNKKKISDLENRVMHLEKQANALRDYLDIYSNEIRLISEHLNVKVVNLPAKTVLVVTGKKTTDS